jgi:NAD(P)-dependent dehydrogenase (short-subunit alcohol dehydrogenase family)
MSALPSMFDLHGQLALVTGAAGGLGLAIAEILLEAGAAVVLVDHDAQTLSREAARLRGAGLGAVHARRVNVSRESDVDTLFDEVTGTLGSPSIVFANAGISAGRGFLVETGQLQNVQLEHWQRVLDVNLSGVLLTMRAAARAMKPPGRGRIIVTASIAGLRAEALSGYAYVASKAAVINLVRQAAVELAPHGVLVNAIAPGPFATELNGGRLKLPDSAERLRTYIPLGRIAAVDEIKGVALLLASGASSYMTGAVIPVDGGASAR